MKKKRRRRKQPPIVGMLPLSPPERRVFEVLRGVDEPKIAKRISDEIRPESGRTMSPSRVAAICVMPSMIQRHVRNRPGVGYWIDKPATTI